MKVDKETQRLDKLRTYQVLDSSQDPSFDKLAKLASAICGTPIALISLIDENRQWFKSTVGLDDIHETPRNISFCTHTIQGSGILEIPDTFEDERFATNPLVLGEPKIRFYAGSPLTTSDGFNLGTLCVIDSKPHHLTKSQLDALGVLSQQVVELMELRKANRELSEAKKLIEDQQQIVINKARLQTIGELAGGVCHQINNPLAIIVGRSMILRSQLKQKLPEDQELLKELDVIDQTSQRVSNILKALRMYSKDLGDEVSTTNIQSLLEDAMTLIKNKVLKEKIDVKMNKDIDAEVTLNKNQVSQVILDLLNNSIDAMEESKTKNLSIDLRNDETHVYLLISDSGTGVKEEDQAKIFEPFYTTKSRHFGVGLSNARNLMRQNNGGLKLLSPKNPTVFELRLPKSA